jgi:hypothetical protein
VAEEEDTLAMIAKGSSRFENAEQLTTLDDAPLVLLCALGDLGESLPKSG